MSDAFSRFAMREIGAQQTRWAELREIDVDSDGATLRIEDNLRAPLTAAARRAFARDPLAAPPNEPGKPAELLRLDSRAALVANLFDYWSERDCAPLAKALGFPAEDATLEFGPAIALQAASAGTVSATDVLLRGQDRRPLAVIADFTEPYQPGAPGRTRMFSGSASPGVWGALQDCRSLALERCASPERFRRIDATRLLEQGLALSNEFGSHGFRMLQVWYEVPGHAAREMRREIDRFRMRIGGEIDFASITWQELFAQLQTHCGEHLGYADYARGRYFPA